MPLEKLINPLNMEIETPYNSPFKRSVIPTPYYPFKTKKTPYPTKRPVRPDQVLDVDQLQIGRSYWEASAGIKQMARGRFTVLSEPYQLSNLSLFINIQYGDTSTPTSISLADHAVVPYRDGTWNPSLWIEPYMVWRQFGGLNGQQVTLESIKDLLHEEFMTSQERIKNLPLSELEGEMTKNALLKSAGDLDTRFGQLAAIRYFEREAERFMGISFVDDSRIAADSPRRVEACQRAIELLV